MLQVNSFTQSLITSLSPEPNSISSDLLANYKAFVSKENGLNDLCAKEDTVSAMRAAVLPFGLWGTAERSEQPKA